MSKQNLQTTLVASCVLLSSVTSSLQAGDRGWPLPPRGNAPDDLLRQLAASSLSGSSDSGGLAAMPQQGELDEESDAASLSDSSDSDSLAEMAEQSFLQGTGLDEGGDDIDPLAGWLQTATGEWIPPESIPSYFPNPLDYFASVGGDPVDFSLENHLSTSLFASSGGGTPIHVLRPELAPRYEPNTAYWYDDGDMNELLQLSVDELQMGGVSVMAMAPQHPALQGGTTLGEHITNFLNQHGAPQTLLTPYNPTLDHWVGIYITLPHDEEPAVALYMDPMGGGTIPQEVQDAIQQVWPGTMVQLTPALQQTDDNSCGPITIMNLVNAAMGNIQTEVIQNSTLIRQEHLSSMRKNASNSDFFDRQYHNRRRFSYKTVAPSGVAISMKAYTLPVGISSVDKRKVNTLLKALENIMSNSSREASAYSPQRLRGQYFMNLFSPVADVEVEPLHYSDTQVKYSQIPWEKLYLWWWTVGHEDWSPFTGYLWDSMMADGSFQHLHDAFSAVANNSDIPPNAFPALERISVVMDYFYGQQALEDILVRINELRFAAGVTPNALDRRNLFIATLRTIQTIGEYFHQCEGLPLSLKKLLMVKKPDDSDGREKPIMKAIRNESAHLTPQSFARFLELFPQDQYAILVDILGSMREYLQNLIQFRTLDRLNPAEQWQRMQELYQGQYNALQNFSFTAGHGEVLKTLFNALCRAKKETMGKAEQKSRLTSDQIGEIAANLILFSVEEEQLYLAKVKRFQKEQQDRKNLLKQIMKMLNDKSIPLDQLGALVEELLGGLAWLRDDLRDGVLALVRERVNAAKAAIPAGQPQNGGIPKNLLKGEELHQLLNLQDDVLLSEAFLQGFTDQKEQNLWKRIRSVLDRRKEVQKALSNKIDANPVNRMYAYNNFLMELRKMGVVLPESESGYWKDIPGYLRDIFARMVDEEHSQRSLIAQKTYRNQLLAGAKKAIETLRRFLGIEDITFDTELNDDGNGIREEMRGNYREQYPRLDFADGTFPYRGTQERLNAHLNAYPFKSRVLEFLVGLGYEHLRHILLLPDFRESLGRCRQVRNFYEHPDPSYLRPLIIWHNGGEDIGAGSILDRPDRNDGHFRKLLLEAGKLGVGLGFLLDHCLDKLKLSTALTGRIKIKPDGDCMYNAVIAGVRGNVTLEQVRREVSNRILNGDVNLIHSLLVQLLVNIHDGDLEGFGAPGDPLYDSMERLINDRRTRLAAGETEAAVDEELLGAIEPLLPMYIQNIQNNGFWGGNVELGLLSQIFGVNIIVHGENGCIITEVNNAGDDAHQIHLIYNGDHYDLQP